MLSRLIDFLESRGGFRTLAHHALHEPVPGGARFLYVPASVVTLLIALQFVTGIALAFYYAPSTATAWASIVFLEEKIRGGWLVRGLHAWGASAVVIALLLHFLQVTWTGAYKKPRELNWATGLLLGLVVLGFALTGYLLPWDQKGYAATKVATAIAGSAPAVGPTVQRLAQGGEDYGNLTLTRFYAIHAILLPGILVALVSVHLWLFRRHGVTPPASVPDDAKPERFFPAQVFRDLIAFLVAAGLLVAWTLREKGAPLEAPADPTSGYLPRPEWYFLPLFELLKHFPGSLEFVGAQVLPAVVFVGLLLVPWIDRAPSRAARNRLVPLALALGPLLGAVALGSVAALADANDANLRSSRLESEEDARLARRLFLENGGVPPEGPLALLDRHLPRLGRRVFVERCSGCHEVGGRGGGKGPSLDGYLSQRWLEAVIRDPREPRLFGFPGFKEGMGATDAKPDELAELARHVRSLGGAGPATERGKKLWDEKDCAACHSTKPGARSDEGPNLAGYGSREWLIAFTKNPRRFYGERNEMPAFEGKLSDRELEAVVVYLKSLGDSRE